MLEKEIYKELRIALSHSSSRPQIGMSKGSWSTASLMGQAQRRKQKQEWNKAERDNKDSTETELRQLEHCRILGVLGVRCNDARHLYELWNSNIFTIYTASVIYTLVRFRQGQNFGKKFQCRKRKGKTKGKHPKVKCSCFLLWNKTLQASASLLLKPPLACSIVACYVLESCKEGYNRINHRPQAVVVRWHLSRCEIFDLLKSFENIICVDLGTRWAIQMRPAP